MEKRGGIFLFAVCAMLFGNAQQVVPAGGHCSKKDVAVEWIIAGNLFNNVIIVDDQPGNKSAFLTDKDSDLSFKVYPSFTKDLVTIEINSTEEILFRLDVYNTLGSKVMQRIKLDRSMTKIDFSGLNSGTYFIKISEVSNDRLLFTQKVVKL